MERMRSLLFLVLMMGMAGTWLELMLTSHNEDVWQKVPIALLVAGILLVPIVAFRRGKAIVAVMRVLMVLFMMAGALGTWFHYESNAEFAAELTPGLSGFALFSEAITRPTPPPLAPGTMIMLGLIGLVCCYGLRPRQPGRTLPLGE